MGMGNRQGSGHNVEDESGSLDVIAQNSGQHSKLVFQYGSSKNALEII